MGRKRTKINAIRGERLKALLEEKGIDQKVFAGKIGYTAEHISYIINGKRNLTQDAAEAIVKMFPDTRIGWLLGYEDFKTNSDVIMDKALEVLNNRISANKLMVFAAKFLNYRLTGSEIDGMGYADAVVYDGTHKDDGAVKDDGDGDVKEYNPDAIWGYLFDGNNKIEILEEEYHILIGEMVRYAMFLLEGLVRRKTDTWSPFNITKEILDDKRSENNG